MKEGFFKNLKSFFNNKKSDEASIPAQKMAPRIVNFSTPSLTQKKIVKMNTENTQQQNGIDFNDDTNDLRYQNLNLPDLKQLGLNKNEIKQGQVAILYQTKFVFCKLKNQKYQEITLLQTNYKICIKPNKDGDYLFFPLGKIQKLHKYTNNENAFKLLIGLKDGRKFKFKISSENSWKKIYDKIQLFAFLKSKKHFFAFKHFEAYPQLQEKYQGWQLYNPIKQFQRMGITLMEHTQQPITNFTSDFKILDNRDGKICTTYSSIIIVPSRMPYDYLVRCSKFRSRCRMPALSYVYQYEPGKFSTIYRSSQSKVGVQNSRCAQDQIMLRIIGDHSYNPKQETEYVGPPNCKIYDARNYIAALGNKFSGKGYQYSEFYKNCELDFLNIPNIHVVRESYNKVIRASFGQDLKFHNSLADSQWYDYVFLILSGSVELAKNMMKGYNNLVHCSDGWDRTSQLCSLAGIILDPYYRTIQGFQILIQKDWIHFGHQFGTRLGQGMNNPSSQQKSPIFIQFLDCVSQILYQYPSDFQFNYKFLQQIGQQAYSHLYGNFLCNCELEMEKLNISKKTISLWSYIAQNKDNYLNPFYTPVDRILEVSSAQKNMRFWKQHFLQYIQQFRDVYDIYSCKFTQENLQIMHKQLLKEKQLLLERYNGNQNVLEELNKQIQKRTANKQENKNPQILKSQDIEIIQINQQIHENGEQTKIIEIEDTKEINENTQ